jgi:hypothetical protein
LRAFAATEEIRTIRHAPVEKRCDGKLYIISCRDPLHQYLSLYGYGCKGAGGLRNRLDAAGKGHLYDKSVSGFAEWLQLIVTPEGCLKYSREIDPMYEFAGFQTVRFMRMALPRDHAVRKYRRSEEKLKTKLKTKLDNWSLMDVVLRQETLNADLATLVANHAERFRNVDQVQEFLTRPRKTNKSPDMKIDLNTLPAALLQYVQEREWLYFGKLGYQPYV